MSHTLSFVIALFLLFLVVLFLYVLKMVFAMQKKNVAAETKDTSQVGFVVDTFHELVSQLKEKEKELEILRREAEEKAFAIETYNENILQSVPSGVISFDSELKVTKVNFAAEKILGVKEAGIVGKSYTEIFGNPISEMIEKKEMVERTEFGYTTQSGKRIWLGLNMSPLKDGAGSVIGRILVFTDLTELKAFQSRKELRERLSTLGEMSAGIAHELRNPMAVISGYTKILSKKVDEGSQPAVDAIAKEVAVMDRIIGDFLSFAKPKELVLSDVNLKDLMQVCVAAVMDGVKGIELTDETAPLPVIRADEVLLRQSVINLLQNAIEAMPDGGKLKISGFVKNLLVLSIADTGHGIPDSIRNKIFLPFYTTKEKGTGLGLSIVHKVVTSHGGTIQVETGEEGTTFTIKLPKEIIVR